MQCMVNMEGILSFKKDMNPLYFPTICAAPSVNQSHFEMKHAKIQQFLCKICFIKIFEEDVHQNVIENKLFSNGDTVAIGASGGKDSSVLIHVLKVLNDKYNYRIKIVLVSIDEGIKGYRDDSLLSVKKNCYDYNFDLFIVSFKQLYGWSMDEIVAKIGRKSNCTFCGVFRRQALDRAATHIKADKLVTGHNADDVAETIVMNMLRCDAARLSRCTNIITNDSIEMPRSKPMMYCYEKDIVMYAHFQKLKYFSTECTYFPNSFRGYARDYVKDLEKINPLSILNIISCAQNFDIKTSVRIPTLKNCQQCNYVSSNNICAACKLINGLEKNIPLREIIRNRKVKFDNISDSTVIEVNRVRDRFQNISNEYSNCK
ncbi:hypothetical protein A3Q56_06222 [Intoshia linei]|uniref:Cytoplasmic tRNA 2-thiolation protein 1 n=1 Tax=Intoshia linei TaxID=1819745 RepID=A0A177AVK2_9BILA|nr:hypothetical protein A3Q56_06222 [Intoshia linei]